MPLWCVNPSCNAPIGNTITKTPSSATNSEARGFRSAPEIVQGLTHGMVRAAVSGAAGLVRRVLQRAVVCQVLRVEKSSSTAGLQPLLMPPRSISGAGTTTRLESFSGETGTVF